MRTIFAAFLTFSLSLQMALPGVASAANYDRIMTPQTVIAPVGMSKAMSVAVLDLESKQAENGLPEALSDLLRIRLFKTPGIQVLERSRMEDVLTEQHFQLTEHCDDSCLKEAGKILGIDHIILGSIHKINSFYSIHLRIVDINTGKVTGVATAQCECSVESLLTSMSEQLVEQLLTSLSSHTQMGQLLLETSPPGADVFLNQLRLGKTPLAIKNITSGNHRFTLSLDEHIPQVQVINIQPFQRQQKTVKLESSDRKAMLELTSKPSGAKVYLNGISYGTTPIEINSLSRNVYTLELELEGHQMHTHNLLLNEQQKVVYHTLLKPRSAEASKSGQLQIFSTPPRADVFIDNQYMGKTPFRKQVLEGDLELKIERAGYLPWTQNIQIKSDQNQEVDINMELDHQTVSVWVAAGLGAAILLASLFFQQNGESLPRAAELNLATGEF